MAKPKSKRGTPALFELLQGNRFRRSDTIPPPNLRVVHHDPESGDAAPPMAQSMSAADGDALQADVGRRWAMNFKGDRLVLSLTPVTAAAGTFVILLLVIGVYMVGRQRGEKTGVLQGMSQASVAGEADVAGIETVRQQPPASHLIESLLEPNAKRPAQRDPAPRGENTASKSAAVQTASTDSASGPRQGWARDYTYIVAQEFAPGRIEDARRAQEFLVSKGMSAQIVKLDSGAFQLITTEGYNHKDPAQKKKAEEILKKQRAVGAEYFASGGGYKLEGYFKTLKKDQW